MKGNSEWDRSIFCGECSPLSESDAFRGKNWRMIGMIVVVRAKCFEMTFVSWLGHCRRERVRGFYHIIVTIIAMALFFLGLCALPMTCLYRTSDNL